MRTAVELEERSVFLNFPFDSDYEPLFIALISALVAMGRTPRCVLEVAEEGDGRLRRIFTLIRSCAVSIHDLSCVEPRPPRFNMPFELGIAVALRQFTTSHRFAPRQGAQPHRFVVVEAKKHRLQTTLSDLNGIDPAIHGGTAAGMISCVLSSLGKPTGNPAPERVHRVRRKLARYSIALKNSHRRLTVYSRSLFSELVAAATIIAGNEGLLAD